MSYNPHTPRVNAFEALWATDRPIPYERPLPDYYYASLEPVDLRAQIDELVTEVQPDTELDMCVDCGMICSCLREE